MPKYRLQVLLEIRERAEQEKKEALAEAKKILLNEKQKAEELRKQHVEMKEQRVQKEHDLLNQLQRGQISIKQYQDGERYLKRMDREIEDFKEVIKKQEKKVYYAQQNVEWAQEELILASQEKQALEKHKEKWQEQIKKERAAKEAMMQEEIATTLYIFGKK